MILDSRPFEETCNCTFQDLAIFLNDTMLKFVRVEFLVKQTYIHSKFLFYDILYFSLEILISTFLVYYFIY